MARRVPRWVWALGLALAGCSEPATPPDPPEDSVGLADAPEPAPEALAEDAPAGDLETVPETASETAGEEAGSEVPAPGPDGADEVSGPTDAGGAEVDPGGAADDAGDVDSRGGDAVSICPPLTTRCDGVLAQKCTPDGTVWITYETCVEGQVCALDGCCTLDCKGKACGPDGCGGTCGACAEGASCVQGACVKDCVPECAGKACGDDGCGGDCGKCKPLDTCEGGVCVPCKPSCEGKACGGNGCGGTCGSCLAGQVCDDSQCKAPMCAGFPWEDECCRTDDPCGLAGDSKCACDGACPWDKPDCQGCVPKCGGKQCGPNGCGGLCGLCTGDTVCVEDQCVAPVCPGYSGTEPCCKTDDPCGWASDGLCDCGSTCPWDWGDCPNCVNLCDVKDCGPDGCGGSCGTCPSGFSCQGGFCQVEPCPGYLGTDPCCKLDDPCGKGGDFLCDCDATCEWDFFDCLDCDPEVEECPEPPPCEPDCEGKECGPDGCGGACGLCPADWSCVEGLCYAPYCEGWIWGGGCCALDDSCGWDDNGHCDCDGLCPWDANECKGCIPKCGGKDCGPDGCGGTCGTCDPGKACKAGVCDQPFCPGYSGTEPCCKINDPCGWGQDEVCDCGGTCSWDEIDCPVAVCGNGLCESAESPSKCPEDCL